MTTGMIAGMRAAGGLLACVAMLGAGTAAPTVAFTNPTNGQTVTSMRGNEASPTLGSVTAPSGLNRCTVEYKRVSDSNYWNGTAWTATTFTFTATASAVNPSPPYYTFRVDAGPGSASLTHGAQYLLVADCVETNGGRTAVSITVTGA